MAELESCLPRCGKKADAGCWCSGCKKFTCGRCALCLIESWHPPDGTALFSMLCPHCSMGSGISDKLLALFLKHSISNPQWSFPVNDTKGCEHTLVFVVNEWDLGVCHQVLIEK